jgi:hypothetical protein
MNSSGVTISGEWPDVDEVLDDGEVGGVGGEEWYAVDVGGCRDREIDGAPAWLSAALGDCGGEAAPFAGHGSVNGERVERSLDHAETLRAECSLVRIGCDQSSEMKFGEGGDADDSLELFGDSGPDEYGGVEEDAAHVKGSTNAPGNR